MSSEVNDLYFQVDDFHGRQIKLLYDSLLEELKLNQDLNLVNINKTMLNSLFDMITSTLIDDYGLFHSNLRESLKQLLNNVHKTYANSIKDESQVISESNKLYELHKSNLFIRNHVLFSIESYLKAEKEWLMLGDGRYKDALVVIDKAIELNPEKTNYYYIKGDILFNLREYKDALAFIDKFIELDPKIQLSYSMKSRILKRMGRYTDALAAINKAIELDPKIIYFYYDKGDILFNLRRYKDALVVIDKGIELDPKIPHFYAIKAHTLAKLGRKEEAC